MPSSKSLLRALTIAAPIAVCGFAICALAQSPTPAELARLNQLATNFAQLDRYAAANAALPPAQKGRNGTGK